jgi:hypothetical protein
MLQFNKKLIEFVATKVRNIFNMTKKNAKVFSQADAKQGVDEPLFPYKLAGSKSRDALEEAGEMMGEVKT